MSSNYNWFTTTCDGLDNSMPLAVLYDAKLKILDDVSDSGEDQMSINFIKSQWSFWSNFPVSEADTLGLQLFRINLNPQTFSYAAGANEVYHTPVSYLAKFFGLYRGGIEIMFKFVKTGFHSGSLAFTYVPGAFNNTTTFTDTSFCYRTVVDLQEGDHCCFRCPYLLPLDFMEMGLNYGALFVHVVNPLRSPETCASSFETLVYVRGAESLQYQKPIAPAGYPITQQGGEVENISTDIICEAPGDAPVAPLTHEFCQDSISETVSSMLQLIKRYNVVRFTFTLGSDDYLTISPWGLSAQRYVAATLSGPTQLDDPIMSLVLCPFAFYRGSMRYRMSGLSTTGTDLATYVMVRTDGTSVSSAPFAASGIASNANSFPYNAATTSQPQGLPPALQNPSFGGLSVSVPYQNVYRMCPVQLAFQSTTQTNFFTPRVMLQLYVGSNRNRAITRSVGDDFQALFWVGIPRLST